MLTILDGGMGRQLEKMGAPFRQPEWSALALIEDPEAVVRAHTAFLGAGCDVITTNSYALVPFHIGEARFAREGEALASLAGQLARRAAQPGAKVAGSLPPLFGSYRPDLFDRAKARAIEEPLVFGLGPHVDHWLLETQSSIAEVETIIPGLDKDVWVSFTLLDDEGPPRLRSGESVGDAVARAASLGARAVLFNCSIPERMADAVSAARATTREIEIGVYANAFPATVGDDAANEGITSIRDDLGPERYAAFAREWVDRGASIIGGCCGIAPEHIAALAQLRRRDG